MSMDAYANYVVKTAMDFIESSPQRDQLFGLLVSHLTELVSDGMTFPSVVAHCYFYKHVCKMLIL